MVIPRRSKDALANVKHIAARADHVSQQHGPGTAEPLRLVLVRGRRSGQVEELAKNWPQYQYPGPQEAQGQEDAEASCL